jgi:aarF domain-containing kinase
VVNRDWESLVRLYQRLGFIPPGTDLRPIELALERALPEVLNAKVSELNIKNIFNKLGDIMYTYPFSLPPFYIAIIRCLGVLEGLAIQVDPQARVVSEAYPYGKCYCHYLNVFLNIRSTTLTFPISVSGEPSIDGSSR